MNTVYQEMGLSESSVYNLYNSSAELTQTLIKAIKNSTTISSNYIEEQLLQIKKSKPSALSDKVLNSYNTGEIVLLYSNIAKIPQAIPFFATKANGKVKVVIFMNNYGKLTKSKVDGETYLEVPMKDLYALMEGAYVTYEYTVNKTNIIRDYGLMRICMDVYSQMFLRLFYKDCALAMDLDAHDRVNFCLSKFFINRVWGNENTEHGFSYARNNLKNATSSSIIQLNEDYDNAEIYTIKDLFEFLRTVSPRMKSTSLRYTSQQYMNTYKPTALFAMEVLPYFLFTVEATMIGSFLVNSPIIGDIIKNTKGMNIFYPELNKLI